MTLVGAGSLDQKVSDVFVFQIRQSLKSACNDAMHEGVSSSNGCRDHSGFSREWFEWANAMFVVLVETGFGERCGAPGKPYVLQKQTTAVILNKKNFARGLKHK